MSLRVFISYSAYDDQIIALRLQTLASVYGFSAYVPPATTRERAAGASRLSPLVERELNSADVIFAVVNHIPSEATIAELNHALARPNLVIPIVGRWVDRRFLQSFPKHFILDPLNPSAVERDIVAFLQKRKTDKETKQAVIGLAALVVGLLLLSTTKD